MDWNKAIKVDPDTEPSYGHDQAYVSYPTVFPTVTIQLLPTGELLVFAGDNDGSLEEAEISIGINGFTKSHVDNCITAIVEDEQKSIDLSEEDQAEIWDVLDEQCWEAFGKGCEQMLDEAKALI